MTKLSDTQLVVLSAAAKRPSMLALPLPPRLKGGAAHKVIKPLIAKGLLEEVDANLHRGNPMWRETGDGHGVTLVITAAGLKAIGLDAGTAPQATAPAERKTRNGTKQATVIEMLRRPEGATLDELATATNWQLHTIRGAMAGALKKKLGLTIVSEKIDSRGRCYKISAT